MRKRSEVAGQMASAAELQAAEAPREFNREMLLSRLNSVRSELESIQATLAD
jgi:hypothetical protein